MPSGRLVKLKVGESIALRVGSTSVVQGKNPKYPPDVCFDGKTEGGEAVHVFVSKPTAERQLARLNLEHEGLRGVWLRFSKIEKGGSVYNDIDLMEAASGVKSATAGEAQTAPRTAEARQQPAPAPTTPPTTPPANGNGPEPTARLKALFRGYDHCFAHALRVREHAAKRSVDVDPVPVAATLFIQAGTAGVLF